MLHYTLRYNLFTQCPRNLFEYYLTRFTMLCVLIKWALIVLIMKIFNKYIENKFYRD